MKQTDYHQLKETLYSDSLPNGLSVYLLPKKGFSKTYATFTTKFGSIDNHFFHPDGREMQVPDGVAHFLEHKMFEQETGDVFHDFARLGASANAFTSFTRTAYLFSCTDHVEKNLETLIDFVQDPHFTDENVEKEKGIIGQEIRMYDDDPDWRLYFGLIQSLYRKHPVQIDIAGTVESIAEIDKQTLYDCYRVFYHPSNMLLFVVGQFEPERIMELVRENQARKNFQSQEPIQRVYTEEPQGVDRERHEVQLSVGIPKCLIGVKDRETGFFGEALLRREITTLLLLDILFGTSSALYEELYEEGIINDSIKTDYSIEKEFGYSTIGADTTDPAAFEERVKTYIRNKRAEGIEPEAFERIRRKKIGSFLHSMNSIEFIANSFTRYRFNDTDLFKIVPVLENITLEQVNERLQEHFDERQMAVSLVTSDEK